MNIKGAIFDMDGTLLDSLGFWGYFWPRVGEKYFGNSEFYPEVIDKAIRTMIFEDGMSYFKDYYKVPDSIEDIMEFSVSELRNFYVKVAKPKDGAFELLEYLKGEGVGMVLASATNRENVMLALEACGMLPYFDAVLSCADIGVGRDKPDIYLLALKSLGTAAKETYIFEDSFVAIETARAIGLNTVGVFDEYNFDHDRLRRSSMIYLGEETDMRELIGVL